MVGDCVSIGVFTGGKLISYCIFEPVSVYVTNLVVDNRFRNRGIGSLLFNEIIDLNKSDIVKIINTDITNNSVTGFLNSKNIPLTGEQFEMIKTISKNIPVGQAIRL